MTNNIVKCASNGSIREDFVANESVIVIRCAVDLHKTYRCICVADLMGIRRLETNFFI